MCHLPQPLVAEPFDRRVVADRGKYLDDGWRLTPFQPWHAPTIARWVQTEQQLRWLAPSTHPPLTAEKILGWKKPGGSAFVLVKGGEGPPWGYGEINPMRKGGEYLWLGHIIVRPDQRGRGMGSILLRALLVEVFERRNATRVALIVFPDNLAALRCYRRVGFSLSGEEIHQFDSAGPTHRLLRLEITRSATREAEAALPVQ
jgi:RimJ/RimL family protein N-acetyltransferase